MGRSMKVDNFQQQLTDDISKIFSQPGAVRLGYSGISDVGKFIHQTVAEAAKSANVAVLGMNDLIFFKGALVLPVLDKPALLMLHTTGMGRELLSHLLRETQKSGVRIVALSDKPDDFPAVFRSRGASLIAFYPLSPEPGQNKPQSSSESGVNYTLTRSQDGTMKATREQVEPRENVQPIIQEPSDTPSILEALKSYRELKQSERVQNQSPSPRASGPSL